MSVVDLAALLAEPSLVRDIDVSDVPLALARLAALQSQLTARLLEKPGLPEIPEMTIGSRSRKRPREAARARSGFIVKRRACHS
jgi:hypothetical protein